MIKTKPKTLEEVQVGDKVATDRCGWNYDIDLLTVEKITNAYIYCRNHKYRKTTGLIVPYKHGYSIRIPTEQDLLQLKRQHLKHLIYTLDDYKKEICKNVSSEEIDQYTKIFEEIINKFTNQKDDR